MAGTFEILLSGLFHAATLFLVAAGLQLVFGVQKIVNLACGAFYALGAYVGISAITLTTRWGIAPSWTFLVLIAAGLIAAAVAPILELLLRRVYARDDAFQMLLTFATLLIFQDGLRMVWGARPQQGPIGADVYGHLRLDGFTYPIYNLLVIGTCVALAFGLSWVLSRTSLGQIIRATAENRNMAEAMGIDGARVNTIVFTAGAALGTIGGALVAPTAAASLELVAELVVEAFAVVVIGGLGNMQGALVGALVVGLVRAAAVSMFPEAELLAVYAIVIFVLVVKPAGLLGKAVET